VVVHLDDWNALTNHLWEDAYVDSDCEDDPSGTGDGAPRMKEEKEERTRAVLITGSFSACVDIPSSFSREK